MKQRRITIAIIVGGMLCCAGCTEETTSHIQISNLQTGTAVPHLKTMEVDLGSMPAYQSVPDTVYDTTMVGHLRSMFFGGLQFSLCGSGDMVDVRGKAYQESLSLFPKPLGEGIFLRIRGDLIGPLQWRGTEGVYDVSYPDYILQVTETIEMRDSRPGDCDTVEE